jgi:peptidoglycan/LPS O-acetylase OafA/YrhL
MSGLLQPVQDFARGAVGAARVALRRGAWQGAALFIALVGAGFLLAAAFIGLRDWLGPTMAALTLGGALLVLATAVLLVGRRVVPSVPAPPVWTPLPVPQPRPSDVATMTVFTTAFMLGRRLAERRGRSGNS